MKKCIIACGVFALALLMVSTATAVPANKAVEVNNYVKDLEEKLNDLNFVKDDPQDPLPTIIFMPFRIIGAFLILFVGLVNPLFPMPIAIQYAIAWFFFPL